MLLVVAGQKRLSTCFIPLFASVRSLNDWECSLKLRRRGVVGDLAMHVVKTQNVSKRWETYVFNYLFYRLIFVTLDQKNACLACLWVISRINSTVLLNSQGRRGGKEGNRSFLSAWALKLHCKFCICSFVYGKLFKWSDFRRALANKHE